MKNSFKHVLCIALILGMVSVCFAQVSTTPIPVKAKIEGSSSITASLSRVTPPATSGGTAVVVPASEINFGTLTLDPTYKIFRSAWYYFMDVGITTNAASWTVTHYANPVAGSGVDLDDHINVSFVRQLTNTTEASLTAGKVSYAASDGKAYSKSAFSTGWLRIYYGLGTGSGDNSGVTAIPQTQTPADYAGQVYLTLTTQ